ncbi:MAG: diguanylate cyclase response regulator, partial [Magnetococcales bacterium]|nr:diguanylate cyclase response regulator [Magnetococcales bacterium]
MRDQKKQSVLVVDDTPENIDILGYLLRGEYTVRPAINGQRALA